MTTQLPKIINDPEASITLMHQVGTWMKQSGLNPSKWWDPQNMNREFLSQHIEPDEYFVAIVDGQPAASFILQDTERNQS